MNRSLKSKLTKLFGYNVSMTKKVGTLDSSKNDSNESLESRKKQPLPVPVTVMLGIIVFMSLMVLMLIGMQSFSGKINDNNARLLSLVSSTYGTEHAEWIFNKNEKTKVRIVVKGEELMCEAPNESQILSKMPLKCTIEKTINPVSVPNK